MKLRERCTPPAGQSAHCVRSAYISEYTYVHGCVGLWTTGKITSCKWRALAILYSRSCSISLLSLSVVIGLDLITQTPCTTVNLVLKQNKTTRKKVLSVKQMNFYFTALSAHVMCCKNTQPKKPIKLDSTVFEIMKLKRTLRVDCILMVNFSWNKWKMSYNCEAWT